MVGADAEEGEREQGGVVDKARARERKSNTIRERPEENVREKRTWTFSAGVKMICKFLQI